MKRYNMLVLAAVAAASWGVSSHAALVAFEDFDGGDINLTSSSVPTLDGGGGDTHAVGATAAWTTAGGTPFSLADNSVGNVGDSTTFAGDNEGVYGVNSDFNNRFLGISDTRDFTTPIVSTWTFDIAGYQDLEMSIGMGSMEGSTFTYDGATSFVFTASIDAGPEQTVFEVLPTAAGDGYSYRALDNGMVFVANGNALAVSGDNPVAKILADSGLAAGNTFLDKTPASGTGAGELDNFVTSINGTGSELVLTLRSTIPFEAAAFDNIAINGSEVPEPTSCAVLAGGALAALALALCRRTNR